MDIINLILAPSFLTNKIYLISLILSGVILVLLEEKVLHGLVFPAADMAREVTAKRINATRHSWLSKILSEWLATIIFIFYSYLGVSLLTEYIISPILTRMKGVITLVVIIIFFLISYCINDLSLRKRIFHD
jgi:hypothetical protein